MNTVFLIDILIIKQQNVVTMFAHCVLSQQLKKRKGGGRRKRGRKSDSGV